MTDANVVQLLSLEDHVFKVTKLFKGVKDAFDKLEATRIVCGKELLALRARIEAGEAGEIDWWVWYGEHFARSRRDAEKVMALASAGDPEAAHEAEKAASRERKREERAPTSKPVQRAVSGGHAAQKNAVKSKDVSATAAAKPAALQLLENEEPMIREYLIEAALTATEPLSIEESARFIARYKQQYRAKFHGAVK
jgi:hypothetical protein